MSRRTMGMLAGIMAGVLIVGAALFVGVRTSRAVTYRAELHCTPTSSSGQTYTLTCSYSGDLAWVRTLKGGTVPSWACGFVYVLDSDTWSTTPKDYTYPDGVLLGIDTIIGATPVSVQYTACVKTPAPPVYTGIQLVSPTEQIPFLSVPNADGDVPCGAFDVNGWGGKFIGLADFPDCTAPVTVMCFTGDGEWTADNVTNVVNRGDYEVDFTSSQDGICGFFGQ